MAARSATNRPHFYTGFRHKPLNPKVTLDSNENLMRLQRGVKLTSRAGLQRIQRGSGSLFSFRLRQFRLSRTALSGAAVAGLAAVLAACTPTPLDRTGSEPPDAID